MVLWTAFASCFALLLGYSRIPYAAARDGYFFRIFGRLHRTGRFPYVSLLAIGLIAIACCFVSLDTVINALIATRVIIQFMGQIVGVALLRKRRPEMERPYRIWLYPASSIVAFAGWAFLFVTTDVPVIVLSIGSLAAGCAGYLLWAKVTRQWPFDRAPTAAVHS